MELFFQQVLGGLATGTVYACIALAIVMIYQAIRHVNFAQGEMAMVSTFVAWQLMQWGLPYWVAVGGAVVLAFVGGAAIDRLLFERLRDASELSHIVGFIGLYFVLNSAAGAIWDYSIRTFPSPFGDGPFLRSALLSAHQAGMLAVTFVLLVALYVFFAFTRVGLAMRAAAANPASARLVGIRVANTVALGWGMAAAIGAIAGVLIAPVVYLEPNMMLGVLVYGFAGAVLGGIASPPGAVLGGLIVGVLENLAGAYIPVVGSEMKLTVALVVIVAVLLLRPAGLVGRATVRRV